MGKCDVKDPVSSPAVTDGTKSTLTSKNTIRKRKKTQSTKISKESLGENLNRIEQSKKFMTQQKFLKLYLSLPEEEKFEIGHHLQDLIVSCTFRGVDCLSSLSADEDEPFMDYESINSRNYGNCFNLFTMDEWLGKSSLTGSSYGLSLVLNIEQDDYLRGGQTLVSLKNSLIVKMKRELFRQPGLALPSSSATVSL